MLLMEANEVVEEQLGLLIIGSDFHQQPISGSRADLVACLPPRLISGETCTSS